MEIVVVIDDAMLDEPVRKAVSVAVNEVVRKASYVQVAKHTKAIEQAVNLYLAKKLADDKIKNMIDNEIKIQMANRIRDLSERID